MKKALTFLLAFATVHLSCASSLLAQGYYAPQVPQSQPQNYPPQYPQQNYPQGYPQGYPPQAGYPQGYPPQQSSQGYPQGYPPQQTPQGYPQDYPPQDYPQGYPPPPAPPPYPPQGGPDADCCGDYMAGGCPRVCNPCLPCPDPYHAPAPYAYTWGTEAGLDYSTMVIPVILVIGVAAIILATQSSSSHGH